MAMLGKPDVAITVRDREQRSVVLVPVFAVALSQRSDDN